MANPNFELEPLNKFTESRSAFLFVIVLVNCRKLHLLKAPVDNLGIIGHGAVKVIEGVNVFVSSSN